MKDTLDIAQLRGDLEETQAQFAKRFAVTQQAVNAWEKRGAPKSGLVRKYLDRLRAKTKPKGGAE